MATVFALLITINFIEQSNSINISNETGHYFISDTDDYAFRDANINCNSTQLCYVECKHSYSCRNTIINCGSANECIIKCTDTNSTSGSPTAGSCRQATFSSNAASTSLTCTGYFACRYSGISSINSVTFDMYCGGHSFECWDINSDLSSSLIVADNFTWICDSSSYTCNDLRLLNISANRMEVTCSAFRGCETWDNVSMALSNYVYFDCEGDKSCAIFTNVEFPVDPSILEVSCYGVLACSGIPHEKKTAAPSNDSISGQFWTSSLGEPFIDVILNCTHDTLCEFNCIHAFSCRNVVFLCNNVKECVINCGVTTFQDETCQGSIINTTESTNTTSISCMSRWYSCDSSTFNIMGTHLNVACDGDTRPCNYVTFNIENVENSTINCGGSNGCSYSVFNVDNSKNYYFKCEESSYACTYLNILTSSNNTDDIGILDIDCTGSASCRNMDVCVAKSRFDLRCCGDNACDGMELCGEMNNINTMDNINVDCECGGSDPCTAFNYKIPTISPTSTPTETTSTPTTSRPTTSTPTTSIPTTSLPTTTSPTTSTPTSSTPTTSSPTQITSPPTTFSPTTSSPTTSTPTTSSPTTSTPTTSSPTTSSPTTSSPTTSTPTTSSPTTSTPTTSSPTTAPSPTSPPTTSSPTKPTALPTGSPTKTPVDGGNGWSGSIQIDTFLSLIITAVILVIV